MTNEGVRSQEQGARRWDQNYKARGQVSITPGKVTLEVIGR